MQENNLADRIEVLQENYSKNLFLLNGFQSLGMKFSWNKQYFRILLSNFHFNI